MFVLTLFRLRVDLNTHEVNHLVKREITASLQNISFTSPAFDNRCPPRKLFPSHQVYAVMMIVNGFRMWKEVAMVCFKVLCHLCPGSTEDIVPLLSYPTMDGSRDIRNT
jgi:hypothetical protein